MILFFVILSGLNTLSAAQAAVHTPLMNECLEIVERAEKALQTADPDELHQEKLKLERFIIQTQGSLPPDCKDDFEHVYQQYVERLNSELETLSFEVIYDNDNYWGSLKHKLPVKDGNDKGYTFGMGANVGYQWQNKQGEKYAVEIAYLKALFSESVVDAMKEQIYAAGSDGQIKVMRKIDLDRALVNFKKGSSPYVSASIGYESRSRTNDHALAASSLQNKWHGVVTVHPYQYISPNSAPGIPAENLKEPVTRHAVLWGSAIGIQKVFLKGKGKLNAGAGFLASSDSNDFIAPDSKAYVTVTVEGSFGKRSKVEPILNQTVSVYAPSKATPQRIGYVPNIGVQYRFRLNSKRTEYVPYIVYRVPYGRTDFTEFNDADPILRWGIRVKILKE